MSDRDYITRFYIPINEAFLEEVDERSKHTSLYLKDLPGKEPPVPLQETSLTPLEKPAEPVRSPDGELIEQK